MVSVVTKYRALDGTEFDYESEAIRHEIKNKHRSKIRNIVEMERVNLKLSNEEIAIIVKFIMTRPISISEHCKEFVEEYQNVKY